MIGSALVRTIYAKMFLPLSKLIKLINYTATGMVLSLAFYASARCCERKMLTSMDLELRSTRENVRCPLWRLMFWRAKASLTLCLACRKYGLSPALCHCAHGPTTRSSSFSMRCGV